MHFCQDEDDCRTEVLENSFMQCCSALIPNLFFESALSIF